MAELVIPTKLAATVVRWEGEGGRRWLARLPLLVQELADEWDLEVGAPFDPGGNISWVAPVRCRADGLQAVLKLQHAPRLVTQPDPSATADPAATLARRLDVVSAEMGVERHAVVAWCLVDAIEMGASARAHGDPEGAERAAGRATLIAPHLS